MPYLLVFLGGGMGSLLRYMIAIAVQPLLPRFPWATLVANGLACLVLGVLLSLQTQSNLSDTRRLLFVTGFCGGLSTFSTFTAETWQLLNHGHALAGVGNIALNLLVCFTCLIAGMQLKSVF